MSFLTVNIHPSWSEFLTPDILKMLDEIEKSVGDNINPPKDKALRFLNTNLDALKVVILGQDPYPEAGVAVGRAFEVGTLKSWDMPFRQVSLKNIIRLIYRTYKGIEDYNDIPTFNKIVKEIKSGEFSIAEPSVLFQTLENQGVLFLNTCFTVTPGHPLSHRMFWEPFTARLIPFISTQNTSLNWFLWGKSAQEYKSIIFNGNIYECRHPMMCSSTYPDDFLKSDCFKKTMDLVNWTGV